MTPLKDIFNQYRQAKMALPAFNIDSFEIFEAVRLAVSQTHLPCLVQLSTGEDKFFTAENLFLLVKKANLESLPIYLNMDHGTDVNRLEACLRLGFDMLHFDGSKMDYDTNLSATKYFVDKVKNLNPEILVEAEFNHIESVDTETINYTDPLQAKEFISQTGADLLAVSIGNSHGVNPLSPEHLNISLLSEIQKNLPDTFLTLHGGSGIPLDQISSAISLGVVKININTDLRLLFLDSLRHQLTIQKSQKIYDYLAPVIADLTELVKLHLYNFQKHV